MKTKLIKKQNKQNQIPTYFWGGIIKTGMGMLGNLFSKKKNTDQQTNAQTDAQAGANPLPNPNGTTSKPTWNVQDGLAGIAEGAMGMSTIKNSGMNKASRQMGNADKAVDMVAAGVSMIPGVGTAIGAGLKLVNSFGGFMVKTPEEYKNFTTNQDIAQSSSLSGIASNTADVQSTIDAYGSSGLAGKLVGRRKKNTDRATQIMNQQRQGANILDQSKKAFEQATSSADMFSTRNNNMYVGSTLGALRFGKNGTKLIPKSQNGSILTPKKYKSVKSNNIASTAIDIGTDLTKAITVNGILNKMSSLSKVPGLETAYDVYNVAKGYSDGDVKQIIPNTLGLLIPGFSGKVIESITDKMIPEISEKDKAKFKWVLQNGGNGRSLKSEDFEKQWAAKKFQEGGKLNNQQISPEQAQQMKEEQEKKEKQQADLGQALTNKAERQGVNTNITPKPATPRVKPASVKRINKNLAIEPRKRTPVSDLWEKFTGTPFVVAKKAGIITGNELQNKNLESIITARMNPTQGLSQFLNSEATTPRYHDGGILPENVKYSKVIVKKYQQGSKIRYADDNERNIWNNFVDYVDAKGYKGNTDLNFRDKGISKKLWDDFNKENNYNYDYDEMIPIYQNTIKAYRDFSINKIKNGKATLKGYTPEQTSDPNFDWENKFQPGLSKVDGWAGSKTTSFKFPGKTEVTHKKATVGDQVLQNTKTVKQVRNDGYDKMAKQNNIQIGAFKNGGVLSSTENVIVDGVLHAHKHNIDKLEGFEDAEITLKGVPVITYSEGGEIEQHAEVEFQEIIFCIEVTEELERLKKINSNESKIEAGKLLVKEILTNTKDDTGLIKSINI